MQSFLFSKCLVIMGLIGGGLLVCLGFCIIGGCWTISFLRGTHFGCDMKEDNNTNKDETHNKDSFGLNPEASTILREVAHGGSTFF